MKTAKNSWLALARRPIAPTIPVLICAITYLVSVLNLLAAVLSQNQPIDGESPATQTENSQPFSGISGYAGTVTF